MNGDTVQICPSCGREITTPLITIGDRIYCEHCRPPEGEEKTQATTLLTMSKTVAATKVIKEVLKVVPDVDLEQASKTHASRQGRPADSADTPSVSELISRADADSKYIYDRPLGQGAMGAVFEIVDQDIRRKVAMKVMLPKIESSKTQLKRFIEEAQVTGQLEHPNIVPVHDMGIDEESKVYYTMKLVRGETLESIISKIAEGDPEYQTKYSLGSLLQIFMKICDGVGYAHAKGVLHRDLKPQNIMIGNFGEVMVMDWGLAKVLGYGATEGAGTFSRPEEETAPSMTIEGQVMGTPSYMSPEQAQGKISELEERSDIFSLGGILYKILTHEAPYRGERAGDALEKARKRILLPPDLRAPHNHIPPELTAICMKAMSQDKNERYRDATNLKNDIQLYLDGKTVSARKDTLFVKMKKWVMRNKVAAAGIAAAIVCLALGIMFTSFYLAEQKRATVVALLNKGESAKNMGDYEEAEEIFFSVLGLDNQNLKARNGIAEVSGKALSAKNKRIAKEKVKEAKSFFDQGEFAKAYDAYVATLAFDPSSADAMAGIRVAAVKAEKQKAQEKVAPIISENQELASREIEIDKDIARLKAKVKTLKTTLKGYEGFTTKKPLWDLERNLLEATVNKLKTEGRIISGYSAVLSYDGENKMARSELAKMHYQKYEEAEALQDEERMAYWRELLLAFDDGYFRDLLSKLGTLTLSTSPETDTYYLYRFVEAPDRRMVPAPFSSASYFSASKGSSEADPMQGIDPDFKTAKTAFQPLTTLLMNPKEFNQQKELKKISLPPGSYLVVAEKKGYLDTRIPVLVNRGDEKVIGPIRLIPLNELPQNFVYVPQGEFVMGGDPDAPYSAERTTKVIPAFLISKHEVTVAEYLKFINYLEEQLPGSAEKYLPRTSAASGYYWKKAGDAYQTDFPSTWPVLGISWNDARAYCRWMTLSHKDKGWEFRLPEDYEWEKAARGVDCRYFPWGKHFDYSFCSMLYSLPGKRDTPDKVGTFPLDESVFGVMDMAGNVSEWCETLYNQEQNMRITRGSAWSFADENFARCAGKTGHTPADVAAFRGFRIVLTLK